MFSRFPCSPKRPLVETRKEFSVQFLNQPWLHDGTLLANVRFPWGTLWRFTFLAVTDFTGSDQGKFHGAVTKNNRKCAKPNPIWPGLKVRSVSSGKPIKEHRKPRRRLLLGHRSLIRNKTQTAVINIINLRILYKLDVSYVSQHTFSKVTVTSFDKLFTQ